MHDIQTHEDVHLLVHEFYSRVQHNPLIGPIFISAIDDWPAHLEKLCRFWETILMGTGTYSGQPFLPHAQMPLQGQHFNTWLQLWQQTIDDFFTGEKAEEAKWRAGKMAEVFLAKINYYRETGARPLM